MIGLSVAFTALAQRGPYVLHYLLEVHLVVVGEVAVIFLLAALWTIYRVGQISRGTLHGLAYAALAILLFPVAFLGLFIVPLMIRGDLRRLGLLANHRFELTGHATGAWTRPSRPK